MHIILNIFINDEEIASLPPRKLLARLQQAFDKGFPLARCNSVQINSMDLKHYASDVLYGSATDTAGED